MNWNKSTTISDQLLRSWIRCRRKAWLEIHGKKQKKIWTAHYTLQLNHQKDCFAYLHQKSHGIGIQACKDGKNIAYGLRIKYPFSVNQTLKANLPLIKKTTGESIWGNFSYLPVFARQGKKLTREHRLSLAIRGKLLSEFQKSPVSKGLILYKNNKAINIQKLRITEEINKDLMESIIRISKDLELKNPPPITSNRKKCIICAWKKVCDKVAIEEGHLSEVCGIGAKRKLFLMQLGINNIKELAKMDNNDLKKGLNWFGLQHGDISKQIILQSNSQVSKKAQRINPQKVINKFKDAPGFLIYDIESDPDLNHDFLHGFIRFPKSIEKLIEIKKIKYQPLLNVKKDSEYLLWKRIQKKINRDKRLAILHYGETEPISLLKLAKNQGANLEELESIKNRFIDIHSLIKEYWCLPVSNYSLKSVAEFIGFKWNQKGADGARALLWWRQWKRSRTQRKFCSKNLNSIFQYNRDDCLATLMIAKWLIKHD